MMHPPRSSTPPNQTMAARVLLLLALGLAGIFHAPLNAAPASLASSGPMPYPTRTTDWPGQGAIRVFDYMNQNRAYFWTQRDKMQGAVVFAGDSLTGGWRDLEQAFAGVKVANRGIGGDVSRGLLFRFQEDVLALQPKAIVLLIGSADLSAQQATTDTVANLQLMLGMARQQSGNVPVVLCTIPPRNNPQAKVPLAQVTDLNDKLRQVAAQHERVYLLDLFHLLAKADGGPDERYFHADQLHINEAGYRVWRTALQPLFNQLKL